MSAYPPYTPRVSFLRRAFDALLSLVVTLIGLTAIAVVVAGFVISGPKHHGPAAGNFDGEKFLNQEETKHDWLSLAKWLIQRDRPQWKMRTKAFAPKPPQRVGKGELRVTFINHATVLIQQDGLNVLTDPTWSDKASPVSWYGPQRFRSPGIRQEDLPPIDVVVISHNHYDHLDLPTLQWLHTERNPMFYVGIGNRPLLSGADIPNRRVKEVAWWEEVRVSNDVQLFGVPARHFSGRGLFDRDRTLWMGFVVQGPAGVTYFAGDTGYGQHFAEIKKRYGAPRVALLPIGASKPEWFMGSVHLSPAEAVKAHAALGAERSVPIHFGTFPLADDAQDYPLAALEEALAAKPELRPGWSVLDFGEGLEMPLVEEESAKADAPAPPKTLAADGEPVAPPPAPAPAQ